MAEDSLVWNGTTDGHAASTDVWSAPYSSAEMSDLFSTLMGSDAARAFVIPNYGNDCVVQANSPAAMNMLVGTGRVFVRGRLYANTAQKTVTLSAADATNPRIDRIVLRITFASQTIEADVLAGTPGATPSLPALTQNATTYEVSLASVWVAATASSVADTEVHDERIFAPNFDALRSSQGQRQLIKNSEFLASITARTYPPANWALVSTPSAVATNTKPSQMVRGNAIQITADAANEGISQAFDCKPSTLYAFRLLYNVTAGDVGSVIVTDNGTSPSTITRNLRRTGSWLEEYIYYTTTSDATQITISLRANSSTDVVQFGQPLAVEGYVPGSFRSINPTESMTLLDEIELSASAASIVINVPTGFKHLHIVAHARGDTASASTGLYVRFNGDSGANYDRGLAYYNGTAWADTESYGSTVIDLGGMPAASAPANTPGALIADIPDYREATLLHGVLSGGGHITGTSAPSMFTAVATGRWRTAAAITSLTFLPGAGNIVSGSRISVYGYN